MLVIQTELASESNEARRPDVSFDSNGTSKGPRSTPSGCGAQNVNNPTDSGNAIGILFPLRISEICCCCYFFLFGIFIHNHKNSNF